MAKPKTDTPTEDLMGRTDFGSWTVVEYAGKYRSRSPSAAVCVMDQWLCRCECGTMQTITKVNLVKHKSKQCRGCASEARRRPDAPRQRPNYALWRNNIQPDCVAEWQDFHAWKAWYDSAVTGTGRYVVRHDATQPHSPTNSYCSPHYQHGLIYLDQLVEFLIADSTSPHFGNQETAEEYVNSLSRQRCHQKLNVYRGLCAYCQSPHRPGRNTCEKHKHTGLRNG